MAALAASSTSADHHFSDPSRSAWLTPTTTRSVSVTRHPSSAIVEYSVVCLKRGGGQLVETLEDDPLVLVEGRAAELLDLDQALQRLAALDERQARVVECRFFGGMSVDETAEALGLSPATVKRAWTLARAWLNRELG
jgi:RNA polymerase sigma factor (sigma-70 family)